MAFSEIGLRTKWVRKRMLRLLAENIRKALEWKQKSYDGISTSWNRILVYTDDGEVAELLRRVPGVRYAAPCSVVEEDLDVDRLASRVAVELTSKIAGKSFKVETRRRKKDLPYKSPQISSMIGAKILERCRERGIDTEVKMSQPDVRVHVEIDEGLSLFYTERYEGEGGYPIGAQSPLVCLLSGGTDSAVASWLVATRGIGINPLFIDQSPYIGCCYLAKAVDVFLALRECVLYPDLSLAVAKVGKIMEKIVEGATPRYICILCKRLMYRIAALYAGRVGAKGIVTGESIGQVASQTVDNLYVISQATHIPVYRPLAGLSKERIHEVAKRIGVYDIAAVDVGYCDILPRRPATRSDLKTIEAEEEKIGLEEDIERAVEKIEVMGF